MRQAVIVSTARPPLPNPHQDEYKKTNNQELDGCSVKAAVERAGIDPALIEDLVMGCGYP